MDVIVERPIKSEQEDKFKRGNFSKNLASKINSYHHNDSLTIGLMGSWGSGKTSIINMMLNDIDKDKVDVIEFNPWYFSGRNQLLSDFFQVLMEEVGYDTEDGKKKNLKNLGMNLNLFSKALKPLVLVPPLAPFIGAISAVSQASGEFSDVLKDYAEPKEINLVKIKKDIDEELSKNDKKILVVIDEIDRLEDDEIKQIFQLVKSLGDFENVIYLLSFDKEKILSVYEPNGELYIDKIVNIPIYVPIISNERLNKLFLEQLSEIYSGSKNFDQKYWDEIYKNMFENRFNDIREMNRFLNIIRFNIDFIVKEVNIVDYLAITYLQLFDKDLYLFICKFKNQLLKRTINSEIEMESEGKVTSVRGIDVEKVIKNTIFSDDFKRVRSINNMAFFDAYFHYSLSERVFTSKEIDSLISINSVIDLENLFETRNDLMLIFDNLDEFSPLLTEKRIYIYLEVLFKKVKNFGHNTSSAFSTNNQMLAFLALRNLCNELPFNSVPNKQFIDSNDVSTNYNIFSMVFFFKALKDKFEGTSVEKDIINFMSLYLEKIEYSKDVYKNMRDIIELGIDMRTYVKNLISNNDGLIKFILSLRIELDYDSLPDYDKDKSDNSKENYNDVIEAIGLEDITDFISYDYLNNRIDTLPFDVKNDKKIKRILDLIESAEPWRTEEDEI